MITDLIGVISNFGFPIAVCVWFMTTQNKANDKLKTAIDNNTAVMNKIEGKLSQ